MIENDLKYFRVQELKIPKQDASVRVEFHSDWTAERVITPDTRNWLQRKPMYGWNPFYRMHANDVKWFGGEE